MCTVPDEEALSPAPLWLSSEWLLGVCAWDVGSWWPRVLEYLGLCYSLGQSELRWVGRIHLCRAQYTRPEPG